MTTLSQSKYWPKHPCRGWGSCGWVSHQHSQTTTKSTGSGSWEKSTGLTWSCSPSVAIGTCRLEPNQGYFHDSGDGGEADWNIPGVHRKRQGGSAWREIPCEVEGKHIDSTYFGVNIDMEGKKRINKEKAMEGLKRKWVHVKMNPWFIDGHAMDFGYPISDERVLSFGKIGMEVGSSIFKFSKVKVYFFLNSLSHNSF